MPAAKSPKLLNLLRSLQDEELTRSNARKLIAKHKIPDISETTLGSLVHRERRRRGLPPSQVGRPVADPSKVTAEQRVAFVMNASRSCGGWEHFLKTVDGLRTIMEPKN